MGNSDYNVIVLEVLWATGCSMILLALLVLLAPRRVRGVVSRAGLGLPGRMGRKS